MISTDRFFKNPDYADYWSDRIRKQKYEEPYRKQFLRDINVEPGESILEIGVGEGRNAIDLLAAGATYVGLDISAEMLRTAREKIPIYSTDKVELLVGDGLWLPFRAHTFDKALCFATIYFLGDQRRAIHGLQSVAKAMIAIEFRNSGNPGIFFYAKLGTIMRVMQPHLRVLLRRKWFLRILSLFLRPSQVDRLSKQIIVYGSFQPFFPIDPATLSHEMQREGWRLDSMRGCSLPGTDRRIGQVKSWKSIPLWFEPVLLVRAVRRG